jgi:lysophospholipase L1-like esterase
MIARRLQLLVLGTAAAVFLSIAAEAEQIGFKFDFGTGIVAPGYTPVTPANTYTNELGYGFDLGSNVSSIERGGDDSLRDGFCTSAQPFFFSVKVPEGNYRVTVTLGDRGGDSTTTIKAESRRLMLEELTTVAGEFAARTFTINVRTPRIASGGEVRLKVREKDVLHWDDKLTLEFNGARPCVCAVEIVKVEDAVMVYLAGDSTVTDQPAEPWNSWGQMLPRFFQPEVAIANHAESGESLTSSLNARRFDKIWSALKPGDYLFIQFGHNDQKQRGEGVGAFTTYQADLRRIVAETRQRGGLPVLVTSMNRRTFDASGKVTNSLGDFPEAVRRVAREEGVPLIDLHAASSLLYEALGAEDSKRAFVDNTYHNNYGSYELARCVVEGIKASAPALGKFLVKDLAPFDPARPDPIASFKVPASPQATARKPDGN